MLIGSAALLADNSIFSLFLTQTERASLESFGGTLQERPGSGNKAKQVKGQGKTARQKQAEQKRRPSSAEDRKLAYTPAEDTAETHGTFCKAIAQMNSSLPYNPNLIQAVSGSSFQWEKEELYNVHSQRQVAECAMRACFGVTMHRLYWCSLPER